MNDDDSQSVKRMLFYLYTQDYPDHDVPSMSANHLAVDRYTPPHLRHKTPTTIEEVTDRSANLELSEGATTTHDPRMMNNVLVYAVAEKYDIPDLKDLAKGKFQSLARSKWPHDSFYALAEKVFSTTPDTDMGLRQVVLDICEKHSEDILRNEGSRAGFLEIQAIGAVVHRAAVGKFDQDRMLLDGALAKQIALREELSKAKADAKEDSRRKAEELSRTKADLKAVLDQKNDWNVRLDSLLRNANKVEDCRHCHERFHSYLERLGTFGLLLRCANCRTRHEL